MKRFKFSLQSVYDYKLTVEKTQKADLRRAEALLRELRRREAELTLAFQRNAETRSAALEQRFGVLAELERCDAFFRYLTDEKRVLDEKIQKAEEHKLQCQQRLVATMKEIKTFVKLKDEQYAKYLKEVAAEEEKEISDIVSFKASRERQQQP